MIKIINWLIRPFKVWLENRRTDRQFKKRMEELKKKDPFIYK